MTDHQFATAAVMPCCPTCGAPMSSSLHWSVEERTFTSEIGRVRFTPTQSAIFDAIWRSGKAGIQSTERFMFMVYGNRADGGPERSNNVSVHLIRMRTLLAAAGYTITMNMGNPRQGWKLVRL